MVLAKSALTINLLMTPRKFAKMHVKLDISSKLQESVKSAQNIQLHQIVEEAVMSLSVQTLR